MNGSIGYFVYTSLWVIHSLWLAKNCWSRLLLVQEIFGGRAAHSSIGQVHVLQLMTKYSFERMIWPNKNKARAR